MKRISSKTRRRHYQGNLRLVPKFIPLVDRSDLKSDFDLWPALARQAWISSNPPRVFDEPSSVVIAGLGGSGIIGELIADITSEADSQLRLTVVKDYHLPRDVDKKAIVVGVSCSGNTEETLSILNEAKSKGMKGFTFGSGGQLESFSSKNPQFAFTKTSSLKVPRSSLPALFYPVLKFFKDNRLISIRDADVEDSFKAMSKVQTKCTLTTSFEENEALMLAERIASSSLGFPLVYSSRRTRAVGLRFRQSLNENAKMHAFDGIVPELCHNEIVAWDAHTSRSKTTKKSLESETKPASNPALLLCMDDDPAELVIRFQIIREIIERSKGKFIEAPFLGESYLGKIISMMYFLDYSTYYAAILRGIDPIKTPSIDYLKNELKSRLDYLARFS